ncbi:MAG: SCO family protein [Flavimaricola sp.]|nr:SCO family protein [Flavimaricola sp.]
MSRTFAFAAAGVVLATIAGTWVATGGLQPRSLDARFERCNAGVVAGGDIGGPFTLVDEGGTTVTDVDVITEPSILYFGYTFCPDVCPLDAMRNAQAVDILAEQGISATPIFITIDPARDTPEVLSAFTDNFSDKMIGLTGTDEQVAAASQAYRTFYSKRDGDDPEYYLMDHSTFSYIVLPDYGFVDFIRRDDTSEDVAEKLACYAAAATN